MYSYVYQKRLVYYNISYFRKYYNNKDTWVCISESVLKIKNIVTVSSSSDRTIIMPTKKGKVLCNLDQNDKNTNLTFTELVDWYTLIVLTIALWWQCPWICPSLRPNSQMGAFGCWKETQNYSSQRKSDSCDFIRGVSCHTTLWKRRRRKAFAYDILVYLG